MDWPVRRSPVDWALLPYRRYAEFSGRSTRSEYWWFTAQFALAIAVTTALLWLGGLNIAALVSQQDPVRAEQVFINPLTSSTVALFAVYFLGSLVPSLALSIRRLHDIGFSGWWYLGNTIASALPVVGIVFKGIYIGYMCRDGMVGPNRFGPDPKDRRKVDLFA